MSPISKEYEPVGMKFEHSTAVQAMQVISDEVARFDTKPIVDRRTLPLSKGFTLTASKHGIEIPVDAKTLENTIVGQYLWSLTSGNGEYLKFAGAILEYEQDSQAIKVSFPKVNTAFYVHISIHDKNRPHHSHLMPKVKGVIVALMALDPEKDQKIYEQAANEGIAMGRSFSQNTPEVKYLGLPEDKLRPLNLTDKQLKSLGIRSPLKDKGRLYCVNVHNLIDVLTQEQINTLRPVIVIENTYSSLERHI